MLLAAAPMARADLRRIETAVQGLMDQEAAELVDLEYVHEGGRSILRFFVDKPGGVTLDDCEYFSNRIGGLLDAADLVSHAYVLEVSSPGLERRLKREKDFLRFAGHRVRIRLNSPVDGRRNFTGFLKSFAEGRLTLEAGDQAVSFALEAVEEARLAPEIKP